MKITILCSLSTLFLWSSVHALFAAETDCNPQRWEETIAEFTEKDKQDPPPKGGVVFVGSSSIRMWDLENSFPDMPAINRGFGGSEMCEAVHYFDELVAKHKPKYVVLYEGDNDIAAGKTPKQVHQDFKDFVAKMKEELPEARLIVISIKPSIARWEHAEQMRKANSEIAATCDIDKERLRFVSIWREMIGEDERPREDLFLDDGLHLNDQGYKLWADAIKPYINLE